MKLEIAQKFTASTNATAKKPRITWHQLRRVAGGNAFSCNLGVLESMPWQTARLVAAPTGSAHSSWRVKEGAESNVSRFQPLIAIEKGR